MTATKLEEEQAELRLRWLSISAALGIRWTTAVEMGESIQEAYSEEGRYYHTVAHILDGLRTLDMLDADLVTKLAWVYHDYVYDVTGAKGYSEEASALVLMKEWNDRIKSDNPLPDTTANGLCIPIEAHRLIIETIEHDPHVLDERSKQICVADLLGLASDWDTYTLNADNIRKEYGQFSDEEWTQGREAFLLSWTGTVFPRDVRGVHEEVVKGWERVANRNMINELAILQQGKTDA